MEAAKSEEESEVETRQFLFCNLDVILLTISILLSSVTMHRSEMKICLKESTALLSSSFPNASWICFAFSLQKVAENFLSHLTDVEKFLNEYITLRTTAHLRKVKVEKLEEMVKQHAQPQHAPSAMNNFTPAMPNRVAPYPPAMGPGNPLSTVPPPYAQMTPNSWGVPMPYPPANGSYAMPNPTFLPRWVHLTVPETLCAGKSSLVRKNIKTTSARFVLFMRKKHYILVSSEPVCYSR